MSSDRGAVHGAVDQVGEAVTELIGNAAGTVVEPSAGLQKLGAAVLTPRGLLLVLACAAAYLLGRRARS